MFIPRYLKSLIQLHWIRVGFLMQARHPTFVLLLLAQHLHNACVIQD